MGRKAIKGLEYCQLEVNFFQDRKIRRLVRRCDANAPLVYIAILCEIYKCGYYAMMDEDFVLDIADVTKMNEGYISKVIDICAETDLLSMDMLENHGVLTSEGIQRRYQETCEKCKRSAKVDEYSLLISSEEKPISSEKLEEIAIVSEEMPISSEEKPISSEVMPQSKVKESKEKKRKENYSSSLSSSFASEAEEESGEEKQQEEFFISEFFFKNISNPVEEFRKFRNYNNTGGRHWAKMDASERQSAFELWKPKGKDKPRFRPEVLSVWRKLYDALGVSGASRQVTMSALDDGINILVRDAGVQVCCPEVLQSYIESHLGSFRGIMKELIGCYGKTKLYYLAYATE